MAVPRPPFASNRDIASKVAPVVLTFWVVKILATTVGETGGDAVSMTLNLGYAVASLVFLAFFAVMLVLHHHRRRDRERRQEASDAVPSVFEMRIVTQASWCFRAGIPAR